MIYMFVLYVSESFRITINCNNKSRINKYTKHHQNFSLVHYKLLMIHMSIHFEFINTEN